MRPIKSTALGVVLFAATAAAALAQDGSALINLLVQKGILTEQEADDVRADLAKESAAAAVQTSKGNYLDRVTLTGRFQAQAAGLSTDVAGTTADPADSRHAFLRRIYIGARAQLMDGWSGYLNYDFAGSTFDAATLTWAASDTLSLDFGLRKAPIGLEENFISSGSLKAIERSPATRYFVESNNGRRLGAGSYRQGIFLNGKHDAWTYQLAVTNPERDESSSGAAGAGSAGSNDPAWWAHGGYAGVFEGGTFKLGASAGYLPDQGGRATTGGSPLIGENLWVYSAWGDLTIGKFNLAGEYFAGDVDGGIATGIDAKPTGFWIQPSYRVGAYEAVLRFTHVDSDGRGVQLSDGVRSAPSGGTMNELDEWFLGGNWYIRGNDVKVQAGYIYAESSDTVAGAPAQARTTGVRTQLQVQF